MRKVDISDITLANMGLFFEGLVFILNTFMRRGLKKS